MSTLRTLATNLDNAIEALAGAAEAYVATMDQLNRDRPYTGTEGPHHLYSNARGIFRAAVSSYPDLAKALDLLTRNPPVTVAEIHGETD